MIIFITGLFLCMPFVTIPFIFLGILTDKKHSIFYGILLAILFAIIAYNFNPSDEQDLYRYYLEMNTYYSKIDVQTYITVNMFNNTKFLFNILQFIISHIGNINLLPFIVNFIGYGITFYIIIDYSKIKRIHPITTIIVLIIFITTFYHINFISGLAQYLAISIGILGFYLEYVKEKKKWFYKVLYILPVLIHISMIIIPLIRVVLNFNFKNVKRYLFVILIVYAFFPTIVYQLVNLIPSFTVIASKINAYMIDENTIFTNMYDIVTLLLLIIYIGVFYYSKKMTEKDLPDKFENLIEIILLINLFSILYRDIFSRILNITMLCMNVYLLSFIKNVKNKNVPIILFIIFIFCIMLGNVNINIMLNNDFNGILSNLTENILYYLKV